MSLLLCTYYFPLLDIPHTHKEVQLMDWLQSLTLAKINNL